MKLDKLPILPVLLLIAVLAGGYGIYKNLEFREIQYFSAATDEVRTNPLLAAARLLRDTEGFTFELAEDRGVFSKLLESNIGVLWLRDVSILEDQREAESILNWVRSGGVLLVSPAGRNTFDGSTIPGEFMSKLGLVSLLDESESSADLSESRILGEANPVLLPDNALNETVITHFSEYKAYFKVSPRADRKSKTIINTPHLVHRTYGKGFVTVYSDEESFDNDKISKTNQTYLLLWLTQPARYKNLTIIHRLADKPGLFSELWRKFPIAILIFCVTLVGFLRWASLRLGPVEQELPPIKNNLIAHLEARGTFWHKNKATASVLKEVQQAAIGKLLPHRSKTGHSTELSEPDRSSVIKLASEQLDCSLNESRNMLFGETRTNAALLRTTKALQKLLHRKQLKP